MIVVQHNTDSLFANRQLKISGTEKEKATEQLSSGYRINRAADDAAGLSISEKMRWQIRGLDKASNNLSDGCSYVQVADGALEEVQKMLQRVRELSVQAANDTNTAADRAAIQSEINQITAEMERVFSTTEYNSIKIWDENSAEIIQIGTEQKPSGYVLGQSTSIAINETNKLAVPVSLTSTSYALTGGTFKLSASSDASDPSTYGIIVDWDAYNGNHYTSSLIPWPTPDADGTFQAQTQSFELKDYLDVTANPELAGINFTYNYQITETATLDDIADMIDGTYVACTSTNRFTTEEYWSSASNVSMSSTYINYAALLVSERDFEKYDDLFLEGVTQNNLTVPTSDSDSWIYTFQMDNIGEVKATSTSVSYYSYYEYKQPGHENVWWHVEHPKNYSPYDVLDTYSFSGTVGGVKNALNGTSAKPSLLNDTGTAGGTIEITFALTATNAFTIPGTTETTKSVGSVTLTVPVSTTETVDSILAKINALEGFDVYSGNETSDTASYVGKAASAYRKEGRKIEFPIYGGRQILHIQSSARSGDSIDLIYECLSNTYLGIGGLDVSTYEKAGNSIEVIDNAMRIVSGQRSEFGAYLNRMEHAKANAENTGENTQSAESNIRDADMGSVMLAFNLYDILTQAGQAMLAQSNQSKSRVLELLQ